METGHMTTAVFMDFRKAFDKVWHRGLLYKLTTAGVSLSSVSLSDYLSSRTVAVGVGTNTISPRQPISRLECHRAHTWDLFFSWSLSKTYLPVYLFQPSCMQTMLSFTNRHKKCSNRRAPYLTTLMTPSTDMPWNFKTPSLLLIYGHSPGMESLVLKKPRLFDSSWPIATQCRRSPPVNWKSSHLSCHSPQASRCSAEPRPEMV